MIIYFDDKKQSDIKIEKDDINSSKENEKIDNISDDKPEKNSEYL